MSQVPFHPHRSPVYGTRYMAATTQPAAVLAACQVMRAGGNAFDAAISAAFVLAVTEPTSTGLGGDMFALCHVAATGEILALNGSGRAPRALTLEVLRRQGLSEFPPFHAHTVTVPGAVAGICDLHAMLGSRPLAKLIEPAMDLAFHGFAVAPKTAYFWDRAATRQLAEHGKDLLVSGRAPGAGEVFRNPDLGRTLERIAQRGAPGFYEGPVAEALVQAVQSAGGVMSAADLAEHASTWEEPISIEFGQKRIYECPPNGQGLVALLALGILGELGDMGEPDSPARHHAVIEALRLAFADGRRFIADPEFSRVPVAELLERSYARERAGRIDPGRAAVDVTSGTPHAHSDTVYLSVVDGQGNACSFIQSNYMGVGTGIVPAGTGFSLQNRGLGFSLDPRHANALMPGKRPYHTIIPALSRHADGSLHASFGVMGGFMQPQGHVQVVLAMLQDGLDAQAALDRPRICLDHDGTVVLEQGIPDRTMEALASMGHRVRMVTGHERSLFGRGQIITRQPDSRALCGGSDLRGDGCALGL